jgi:heme A synthase
LIGVFLLQLGVGAVNVLLLAPVWMQLIHLLTADLTWILLIALSAYTFQVEPQANPVDEPRPAMMAR